MNPLKLTLPLALEAIARPLKRDGDLMKFENGVIGRFAPSLDPGVVDFDIPSTTAFLVELYERGGFLLTCEYLTEGDLNLAYGGRSGQYVGDEFEYLGDPAKFLEEMASRTQKDSVGEHTDAIDTIRVNAEINRTKQWRPGRTPRGLGKKTQAKVAVLVEALKADGITRADIAGLTQAKVAARVPNLKIDGVDIDAIKPSTFSGLITSAQEVLRKELTE